MSINFRAAGAAWSYLTPPLLSLLLGWQCLNVDCAFVLLSVCEVVSALCEEVRPPTTVLRDEPR
jgi:hypothetical protein